jgi:hypothetical protein
MELKSASAKIGKAPMLNFIDGLANTDITKDHINGMIERAQRAAEGEPFQKVTWVSLEE